jgi:hypothetical protein
MLTRLSFRKLNEGWNAEPNAPAPIATAAGPDLLLRFALNPFQFRQFAVGDEGVLRFVDCTRYRLGATNDEGWYRGQCRYSASAPAWGEFYEVSGTDDLRLLEEPTDWTTINKASRSSRHFLFYFRDETFECIAADWAYEPLPSNPLFLRFRSA